MIPLPSDTVQKPHLDGITIINMSRVLSGRYCIMVLAHLGDRVIKIGRPDIGNDTRNLGRLLDTWTSKSFDLAKTYLWL